MTKRVLLAGVLGGIAMFFWVSIAHMVLPLGEAGVQEIPNEPAVLTALQSSLGANHGMYLFPGMGLGPNPTRQQQNAAAHDYSLKYAASPSGILVYHPPGRSVQLLPLLSTEFVTELIEALLAVFLLSQTRLDRFGPRVAFITVVGVIAAITTNVSYWNWYAFPTSYTIAYMFTQAAGFLAAGLAVAAVLRKTPFENRSAPGRRERFAAA
jgi:hypothetical protein